MAKKGPEILITGIQELGSRVMLAKSRIGYGKFGSPTKQATDAIDLSFLEGYAAGLRAASEIGTGTFVATKIVLPSGDEIKLRGPKGRERIGGDLTANEAAKEAWADGF